MTDLGSTAVLVVRKSETIAISPTVLPMFRRSEAFFRATNSLSDLARMSLCVRLGSCESRDYWEMCFDKYAHLTCVMLLENLSQCILLLQVSVRLCLDVSWALSWTLEQMRLLLTSKLQLRIHICSHIGS